MSIVRSRAILGVVLLALAVGCGSDSDSGDQAAAPSPAGGSAEAYCAATAELNERAEAIFADVDQDDEAAAKAAQAEVYQAAQDVKLVVAAPAEIKADVRTFIDGVYGPGGAPDEDVAAAEKRVLAYEKAHCEGS